MAVAPMPLQRAPVLALKTRQRQGDLLALPWSAYARDDAGRRWLTLRQSKSKRHNRAGRLVKIPVAKTLQRMLDAMPRACPVTLTNVRGVAVAGQRLQEGMGQGRGRR
jgi:hypothetical protein